MECHSDNIKLIWYEIIIKKNDTLFIEKDYCYRVYAPDEKRGDCRTRLQQFCWK